MSVESNQGLFFFFASLRNVIGPENSRLSLDQSGAKLKPVTTWSPAFSRALGSLLVLLGFLIGSLRSFFFLLIGARDYFGFGFTTLIQKALFFTNHTISSVVNYNSVMYRCLFLPVLQSIHFSAFLMFNKLLLQLL